MIRLACVAVVKNEEAGIAEWLAFQLAIGFDTVILFDNRSTDDTVAQARALAANHDIRIIDWPHTTPDYQTLAYDHAIREWGAEFDWMAFFDTDEFLVLEPPFDLKGILNLWSDAAAIGVPWAIFGSSGHESRPDGLTIEAFQHRAPADFGPNRHIKSIVRPGRVKACLNPHVFEIDGPYRALTGNALRLEENTLLADTPDYSLGKLHHYFTRSRAHWVAKMRRGYHDTERIEDEFAVYDRNEVEDTSALALRQKVCGILDELPAGEASSPGISLSLSNVVGVEATPSHPTPGRTELNNPLFPSGFMLGWEHALLGNCLSSFANLFAFAERTQVTVAYLQLENVRHIVEIEQQDLTIYSPRHDVDRPRLRWVMELADLMLCWSSEHGIPMIQTVDIADLEKLGDISGKIVFLTYRLSFTDLGRHEDALKAFCDRGNGVVMQGAYWYQYHDVRVLASVGGLLKQRLKLRHVDGCASRREMMSRQDAALSIGVHMRRGADYKSWLNGDFYFEIDDYLRVMRAIDEELRGENHIFYVCSDVRIPSNYFEGLPVCYESTGLEDDFAALSQCDFIVGPPSTFGTWSAFLGKGRRIILTKPRLADLKAWSPILGNAAEIIYPTGSFLPNAPFSPI